MWVAVSILNPTLALLALALVPIPDVAPNQEALLRRKRFGRMPCSSGR